jgi:hypothetical protein
MYNNFMWHPKTVEFDNTMKKLFDEVDHYIEDLYGDRYNLHPVRPARGQTANPEADGLFRIGAVFTPGFGSKLGRGYRIDLKIATLDKVETCVRLEIYNAAVGKVKELLPVFFPGRALTVLQCDGNHFKIQGDFSLGTI